MEDPITADVVSRVTLEEEEEFALDRGLPDQYQMVPEIEVSDGSKMRDIGRVMGCSECLFKNRKTSSEVRYPRDNENAFGNELDME